MVFQVSRQRVGSLNTLPDDSTSLSKSLKPRNSTLVSVSNLVDDVWGAERPHRPKNPIVHLDEKFSGESHLSKLDRLKKIITDPSSSKDSTPGSKPLTGSSSIRKAVVLTALDDIAWLFNWRGSDIAYNPVFFAYAVVHLDDTKPRAILFAQTEGIESGQGLKDKLGEEVEIRPYDEIWSYLKNLGEKLRKEIEGQTDENKVGIQFYSLYLWLSGTYTAESCFIIRQNEPCRRRSRWRGLFSLFVVRRSASFRLQDIIITAPSPVTVLKAIKNPVEREGFRQSHIRDGAALARYFAWLEESLGAGQVLTEWQGSEKLEGFRR